MVVEIVDGGGGNIVRHLIMKAFITTILCSLALFSPVFADTIEEATEVYMDTGVPDSDQRVASEFHGILGGGLFSGRKTVGDDGVKTVPLPLVFITYKDIAYWSIGGGGVWLLKSDDHALKFGAGIRVQGGWKPDDDADLAGMERRKGSLDGYLNGKWRTPLVTVGVHYYHDLGDASRGGTASLRLSRGFRIGDGFWLTPSIGAAWLDSDRVDYYYGVKQTEALLSRPAYTGRDTLNFNAGLVGFYRLPRSWSLLGGVFATRYGSGIAHSPIVEHRWSPMAYFGAGWMF